MSAWRSPTIPQSAEWTLRERGLDFEQAEEVLAGPTFDREDDRRDCGEARVVTVGLLGGRMVVLVWTPRGNARHIISMRKANDREIRHYGQEIEARWKRSQEGR